MLFTRVAPLTAILLLAGSTPVFGNPVVSTATPNTFGTAQNVNGFFSLGNNPDIANSTTQPHVEILQLGSNADGFFFYSFTTTSAGTITLDIDRPTNFDTEIHLWDSAGTLLATNDDNGGDPGSDDVFNSGLTTGVLPAGTYIVGVSAFFSIPDNGGVIDGSQVPQGGTFTLNVSANSAVPEPATLAIFGLGIAGLGGYGWRRGRGA